MAARRIVDDWHKRNPVQSESETVEVDSVFVRVDSLVVSGRDGRYSVEVDGVELACKDLTLVMSAGNVPKVSLTFYP